MKAPLDDEFRNRKSSRFPVLGILCAAENFVPLHGRLEILAFRSSFSALCPPFFLSFPSFERFTFERGRKKEIEVRGKVLYS